MVALEGQGQEELFDVLAGNRRATFGNGRGRRQAREFHAPGRCHSQGIDAGAGRPGACASDAAVGAREHCRASAGAVAELGRGPDARGGGACHPRPSSGCRSTRGRRAKCGDCRVATSKKVTIARWIAKGVDTLLLFDPTRGIDIRTKRQTYALCAIWSIRCSAVLHLGTGRGPVGLRPRRGDFQRSQVDVIDARTPTSRH